MKKIEDFASAVSGREVIPHSLICKDCATDIEERTEVPLDTLQPCALRSHGFGYFDVCTPFTTPLVWSLQSGVEEEEG